MKINFYNILNNFLLMSLIALSGMPAFTNDINYILAVIISFTFFIKLDKKFDREFLIFVFVLFTLLILQAFKFNFLPIVTIVGLFIKIFFVYFVIKLVNIKFLELYVKLIYILSIISLIIYASVNLSDSIRDILISKFTILTFKVGFHQFKYNILGIYTLISDDFIRNAGPFWEPGAFAGYLMIAFIFNYITTKNIYDKKSIIILIAIFSTFSTTGYIAILFFLATLVYINTKYNFMRTIIIGLLPLALYISFTQVDFIGKKIEQQLMYAQSTNIKVSKNTQRFLNIMRDQKDFEGHEILGRGIHPETRYSFDPYHQIRTVGLTDILVRFGIVFFIFMLYRLIKSIFNITKLYDFKNILLILSIFLTIIILLMSEPYFNYPFFWGLLFLQFINFNKKEKI